MLVFLLKVGVTLCACLARSVQAKVNDQLTECGFLWLLYSFRLADRFGDE
ncbi:MAG TPA: hypothetical protein ACQGQH_06975 [Xylella sp.]